MTAVLLAALLSLSVRPAPARAQNPGPAPDPTPRADAPTTQFVVSVSSAYARALPDETSAPVFSVFRGEMYAVTDRTSDGAWLQVVGSLDAAGWLPEAFGVGDLSQLPAPDESRLPQVPAGVLPEQVGAVAREYYENGLAQGRNPQAFSKLGDCNTENGRFLVMFDPPTDYRLGTRYSYLQTTIDYFQGSFSRESLAAKSGFSAASLLDSTWADPRFCGATETPLDCELRVNNPSMALVMLGTHTPGNEAALESSMRALLDETLSSGVLPILATKADDVEGDGHVNALIRQLAEEYGLPLWDFWKAVQPLPAGGLSSDGIHFTYGRSYFDDDWAMTRGWTWRNLTALLTLDAVRQAVQGEVSAVGPTRVATTAADLGRQVR